MDTDTIESQVRTYSRQFPAVFDTAKDSYMFTGNGKRYVDFFAGAGALNYGHNPSRVKKAVRNYLDRNGIVHSLDLATETKHLFIDRFNSLVLKPRSLEYKIQFPGPTGTNAVEAAIKLARKVTGRQNIIAFTNAFHGMTLGSLALTANRSKRDGAGVTLDNVHRMPYDGYIRNNETSTSYLEKVLEDSGSGIDLPAAIILETIQAEGGVNCASKEWLQKVRSIADKHSILVIVDDIQVGCGRTGPFFSFEESGITPDLVCLSKSISGIGLPLSLVLIRPEHDIWSPGEHNGTFRGQNLSFVAATEALNYWNDEELQKNTLHKGLVIEHFLQQVIDDHSAQDQWQIRGRGLIHGLDFKKDDVASDVSREAFSRGLIIESCGARDSVIKILPPLTIDESVLNHGLGILQASINAVRDCSFRDSSIAINA